MKITKKQLRRIIKEELIREATDMINRETGEILAFGDRDRDVAPDAAVNDIMKRLGISPKPEEMSTTGRADTDIELSNDDWRKVEDETLGKQDARYNKKAIAKSKADRERLNIDNLMQRVRDWGGDVGSQYIADVPGTDLQDIAFDLADAAKYEFEQDEWDELLYHFDDDENDLRAFIADSIG